jgi:hypothetical protein
LGERDRPSKNKIGLRNASSAPKNIAAFASFFDRSYGDGIFAAFVRFPIPVFGKTPLFFTKSGSDLVLVVNFLCPSVTDLIKFVMEVPFSVVDLAKSVTEVPFSM